jgi:predicted Holliday junction resolvase-like endonuclease
MGVLEKLKQKIEEHKKRREEERKAIELTPEKTERLRKMLPELNYFEKPSHSDVADALTLRLAKKGIYLSDKEARRLAVEVSKDPNTYYRILQQAEAEKVRQRAQRVREKAQRIREREQERRLREREARLAMADAFVSGLLSFDPFSPSRSPKRRRSSRHSRRRRR